MSEKRHKSPRNIRRKGRGPVFRPNPWRQLLWVVLTLAALAVGYAVGILYSGTINDDPPSSATSQLPPPVKAASPWYQNQPPPPSVARLPDAPIYPDQPPEEDGEEHRAYEERLPAEVYVPDPVDVPAETDTLQLAEVPPTKQDSSGTNIVHGPASAWRQHALAVPVSKGRPRIAIVIDDLGIDKRRTARAIALSGPLTMAFLSYATDLERQTAAARAGGHELLVHVPMQPQSDTIDPGPNVLKADITADEILRRLRWNLDRFNGYVGINNHMGSRFTSNESGMAVVMSELKQRGLLFLDSRTSGGSVGARMAVAGKVPYAVRNVFLDNDNDVAAVRARLAETEAVAAKYGLAIAIGHPRDATLEALADWLGVIDSKGFQLVPISATVTIVDGIG